MISCSQNEGSTPEQPVIYGLRSCESTRRALRALPGARLVDVRESPPPEALLRDALERFGARLINTRSTTWRQLPAAERDLPPLELLRRRPTVMKRPLVVAGDRMFLGWDAGTRESLLGKPPASG